MRPSKQSSVWIMIVGLAVGMNACALQPTTEPTTDEASSALQKPGDGDGGGCNPIGYVVCPSVPDAEIEYAPPGCGYPTLTTAWRVCRSFCDVACVGSQY